jgi:hypothetical protein
MVKLTKLRRLQLLCEIEPALSQSAAVLKPLTVLEQAIWLVKAGHNPKLVYEHLSVSKSQFYRSQRVLRAGRSICNQYAHPV